MMSVWKVKDIRGYILPAESNYPYILSSILLLLLFILLTGISLFSIYFITGMGLSTHYILIFPTESAK